MSWVYRKDKFQVLIFQACSFSYYSDTKRDNLEIVSKTSKPVSYYTTSVTPKGTIQERFKNFQCRLSELSVPQDPFQVHIYWNREEQFEYKLSNTLHEMGVPQEDKFLFPILYTCSFPYYTTATPKGKIYRNSYKDFQAGQVNYVYLKNPI